MPDARKAILEILHGEELMAKRIVVYTQPG